MKRKFALGLLLGIFLASFALVGSAGADASYSFTSTQVDPYTWEGVLCGGTDCVPVTSAPMGDKTLSDVSLIVTFNAFAAPITPNDFTLQTYSAPPLNPGFSMSAMLLSTQALGSQDATLTFVVTAPAATPIKAVSVSFVGAVLPNAAGNTYASATIAEFVYTSLNGTLLGSAAVGATGTSLVPSATISFAPQTSLYIVKDLSVQGDGALGASASISQVTERFAEVPLPASLLFLAPGLLGLMGMRKRLRG